MSGDNRIVAFGVNADTSRSGDPHRDEVEVELQPSPAEDEATSEEFAVPDEAGEALEPAGIDRLWRFMPAIAATIVAGWTGFFVWANWSDLAAGAGAATISQLIVAWTVPILLVCILWLVAMRSSRREANRFGDAARLLSDESVRLESRLLTINRELSLAREFIAAQSRDLESLGRVAVERLSQSADRLQDLVRENGNRIETLGSVSEAALDNMEKLRGQLPVIASSAKDVTNNIGSAGRVAHGQLEEMIDGFKRLNEFGQACSREVQNLRGAAGETMAEFQLHCDQMEQIAAARFAALDQRGAEFRQTLEQQEAEALAAVQTRASALLEEIGQTGEVLEREEAERLTSLRARLTTLRDEGNAVARALREGEERALAGWKGNLAAFDEERGKLFAGISEAENLLIESAQSRLTRITEEAERVESRLSESNRSFMAELEQLRGKAQESHEEFVSSLAHRLEALARELGERGERLDAAMAESSRSLFHEVASREEQIVGNHERLLARLSERLEQIDDELGARSRLIFDEIEERNAWIGTGVAEILSALSTQIQGLDKDMEASSQRLSDHARHTHENFATRNHETLENFRDLLATIDRDIAERLERHEQHGLSLARHSAQVTADLEGYEQRLGELVARGDDVRATMSSNLQSLTASVADIHSLLSGAGSELASLTDSSVRLLELTEASVAKTRDELPGSLGTSQEQLTQMASRLGEFRDELGQAGAQGADLAARIETSSTGLRGLMADIEGFHATLNERQAAQSDDLGTLRQTLTEMEDQCERLAEKARHELSDAIDQLSASAQAAVATLSETGASQISALALQLGDESAQAIDRAVRTKAAEAAGTIEQAAAHAAGVSREAAIQLRDQLTKVNELVGNLEQRVSQARERAEEQVDNDFARRVALITESLNSNAIDIAKALSTDVSDTAWASYLRGDRGIFTRRAVNLLTAHEAKAIQQIFERDGDFREHVSRYIHDFEAILRQVLSTRDGNALGITLLSSDMGKLYVALAQSIKRLRS